MVTRYGQADIPREVSGRGRPAVGPAVGSGPPAVGPAAADFPRDVCRPGGDPAADDFPRDVCLTVSRNHKEFIF